MSPPYVFTIIGPPERLAQALSLPEELAELKERSRVYGLGFSIARTSALRVPAFTGPPRTGYAQVH